MAQPMSNELSSCEICSFYLPFLYYCACTEMVILLAEKFANLISKLNFYKLIPYPMDNLLIQSAQTGLPNDRKSHPVFPPDRHELGPKRRNKPPEGSFLFFIYIYVQLLAYVQISSITWVTGGSAEPPLPAPDGRALNQPKPHPSDRIV